MIFKIKENVKLKELKKFGFVLNENKDGYFYGFTEKQDNKRYGFYIYIEIERRIITLGCLGLLFGQGNMIIDILYNLYPLIEKDENHNWFDYI